MRHRIYFAVLRAFEATLRQIRCPGLADRTYAWGIALGSRAAVRADAQVEAVEISDAVT